MPYNQTENGSFNLTITAVNQGGNFPTGYYTIVLNATVNPPYILSGDIPIVGIQISPDTIDGGVVNAGSGFITFTIGTSLTIPTDTLKINVPLSIFAGGLNLTFSETITQGKLATYDFVSP